MPEFNSTPVIYKTNALNLLVAYHSKEKSFFIDIQYTNGIQKAADPLHTVNFGVNLNKYTFGMSDLVIDKNNLVSDSAHLLGAIGIYCKIQKRRVSY